MADILSTNPNTILESFQTAYYNQIGRRMSIGQEEYTLSSIFTYVLTLYAALINASYKNQVIETASGVFLDNLAARYNLTRTPEVYSNPWFEGVFWFWDDCEYYGRTYPKGKLKITVADHVYSNSISFKAEENTVCRFVCEESHTDALSHSELISALSEVEDSNENSVFDLDGTSQYITPLQSVQTPMDDDTFRSYIQNSKFLYTPGIAGSFEALAKASSSNIRDARVRVQGDTGFIRGNVDIFCKAGDLEGEDKMRTVMRLIDIHALETLINEKNLLVIGQRLNIQAAQEIPDMRMYRFFVPKQYNSSDYNALYVQKFKAVIGYLNKHSLGVGAPFMPSMVLNLMLKPLSEVSNDPYDYNYPEDSTIFENFDKYKDLPVIGLESVSSYEVTQVSATQYVRLITSNGVGFSFI